MREWRNVEGLLPLKYICGYCGSNIGTSKGYHTGDSDDGRIYICPLCNKPTFIQRDNQTPSVSFGNPVEHLPADIAALYEEARNCMAVNSFTSAVLTCRKILMSVAVDKGAPEKKRFIEYVNYLDSNNYISASGRVWVDHIRNKGNEANHEIHLMKREDAEELITFTEMLLKLIYEFPSRVPKPASSQGSDSQKAKPGNGSDPRPARIP